MDQMKSVEARKACTLREIFSKPVAHRGFFSKIETGFPENSMPAFERAFEKGLAVECDVRLSFDGKVCVFHDESLKRLTGEEAVFEKCSWVTLGQFKLCGSSAGIPTLEELLVKAATHRLPVVVELKSFDEMAWNLDFKLEKAVVDLLKNLSISGIDCAVALKSFNPHSVVYLHSLNLPWPVGFLSCDHRRDGDFSFLGQNEAEELRLLNHEAAILASFISYGIGDLTEMLSEKVRNGQKKPLMVWTVRDQSTLDQALRLADAVVFEEPVWPAVQVSKFHSIQYK